MNEEELNKLLGSIEESKVPEFNNGECRKTCNCALIHVGGDVNKIYTIKDGYLCLNESIPEIKPGMTIDDHVDRITALKNYFEKQNNHGKD